MSIRNHSGAKYLRTIHAAEPGKGSIEVDVYEVLEAFDVTCQARGHAIKKLLCAGLREKSSEIGDLTDAADAVSRAIEIHTRTMNGDDPNKAEVLNIREPTSKDEAFMDGWKNEVKEAAKLEASNLAAAGADRANQEINADPDPNATVLTQEEMTPEWQEAKAIFEQHSQTGDVTDTTLIRRIAAALYNAKERALKLMEDRLNQLESRLQ